MTAEPNGIDAQSGGTDRYALFLSDAVRWLHYEKANIDQLTRAEVNQLARLELGRRDHEGPVEDNPQAIWAWLFIEYVMYRDEDRDGYFGGDSDD